MADAESETGTPLSRARILLKTLKHDLEYHLEKIDRYYNGDHDDPYMPDMADSEYRLLAERSKTNYTQLLTKAPVQGCYVDGFRAGRKVDGDADNDELNDLIEDPSWDHWQRSSMDSKQAAIYLAAVVYGHSFAVTERNAKGDVITKGLSPMRTAAIYDDPANDLDPVAALHVERWPTKDTPGRAVFWDGPLRYTASFKHEDANSIRLSAATATGAQDCPVTRFAVEVDLDGRTRGIVEAIIPLQDRLNQTVFDLLIAQTYGSFKVRTVTGMAPPLEKEATRDDNGNITGFQPRLDSDGQPVALKVQVNGKQIVYAEDPEVKFGTLDETPLDGYIAALKDVSERLSAVTQTPPTYLLGQIANLSAEALNAAETTFNRKVETFQHAFGEAWERVFRIAGQIDGDQERADDYHGEVVWRDMESRSMAADADGLGKLATLLGVPVKGLWSRVKGVTQQELARWNKLAEEEDAAAKLAEAQLRATATMPRAQRTPAQPSPSKPAA